MEVSQIPPPYRQKKKLKTFADWSSAPNPTYTFKETHQETLPTISPKVQPWSSPTAQIYTPSAATIAEKKDGYHESTREEPRNAIYLPVVENQSSAAGAGVDRID
jgi:hypothetical protein